MNLGPLTVSGSYQYVLNQSGNSITLGDGNAVNWNASNVVTRTGNQTISGNKIFASNVIVSGSLNTVVGASIAIGNGDGANNYLGESAGLNYIGYLASTNYFGNSAYSNTFGDSADINSFGYLAVSNTFGNESNNEFGTYSVSNNFGFYATHNKFGLDSDLNEFGNNYEAYNKPTNTFGNLAYHNTFGESSTNTFGSYAINSFGEFASENSFGSEDGTNRYIGVSIIQDTGRIRLANFTGSSSQTGLRGEARVSGSYLYLCTGEESGWGRIQLSGGF